MLQADSIHQLELGIMTVMTNAGFRGLLICLVHVPTPVPLCGFLSFLPIHLPSDGSPAS